MCTTRNHTWCWERAVSETFCASDGTMPFSFHMHRIRCLSLFMFSLASSHASSQASTQARSPSARRCGGVYNRGFVFGFCVIGFVSGFCITGFVSGFRNTVFDFDSCITSVFVVGFCTIEVGFRSVSRPEYIHFLLFVGLQYIRIDGTRGPLHCT